MNRTGKSFLLSWFLLAVSEPRTRELLKLISASFVTKDIGIGLTTEFSAICIAGLDVDFAIVDVVSTTVFILPLKRCE